jgi:hypothetical protein
MQNADNMVNLTQAAPFSSPFFLLQVASLEESLAVWFVREMEMGKSRPEVAPAYAASGCAAAQAGEPIGDT